MAPEAISEHPALTIIGAPQSQVTTYSSIWNTENLNARQKFTPRTVLREVNRAAACDVTGGVASLNFDATELQIF